MTRIIALYNRIRKYLLNTSWILGDKIYSKGIGLIVAIVIARYLGPEKYGILSYAISMTALFTVVGYMGLEGLLVREIVKKPEVRSETLGTSFVLKALGICVGYVLLLMITVLSEDYQSIEFWLLIIVSLSMLFEPFRVIELWFQALVQAKYSSIARTISLTISAVLNIILVTMGAGLLLFALANIIKRLLEAMFLLVSFILTSEIPIRTWCFSFSRAIQLLRRGGILFLGSFFSIIYLKIDQVMLRWIGGASEVGIYAVTVLLSESWYLVPSAITASLLPPLIALRDTNFQRYMQRLQQIFDLLFWIALSVAIVVTILSRPLISLTFGEEYLASVPILSIHIWAALFVFMRTLSDKWVLIEDALRFPLIMNVSGAFINVLLNLLLIPGYDGSGAAVATLLSYVVASYLSLSFFKKTRPIFWMMTKSFASPLILPLKFSRK